MRKMKVLAVAAVFVLTGSTAFADVQLTLQDGRVSIVAKDATVRQILTEWARVGQTKIVNVEKIPGGPVTLELTAVPESQALDILLRSLSGYLAAPRGTSAANLSTFDRIVVMPTAAQPKAAVASAVAPAQPAFQQPQQFPQQLPQPADDADDEAAAPPVPVPGPNPRGPVFNTFPQPTVVNPQQGTMPMNPVQGVPPQQQVPQQHQQPTAAPGAYGGVAVPGMVVQPPQQQPGQPGVVVGQPVPPGPPRRPGGPGGPEIDQ